MGAALKLGVAILTGGASSRMGEDKAATDWLGVRAVDRLAGLAQTLGAAALITVGRIDHGWPFVADAVPLSGPVGGILAGAAVLAQQGCERALVLAVDAPTLRAADVAPLLDRGAPGAAYADCFLPLTFCPSRLPTGVQANWPVARFIEACGLDWLPCPPAAAHRIRGANTPSERASLLEELSRDGLRTRPNSST